MSRRRGSVSIITILLLGVVSVVSAWMMLAVGGGDVLVPGGAGAVDGQTAAEALDRMTEDIKSSLRVLLPRSSMKNEGLLLFGAAGMHIGYYLERAAAGTGILNRMVVDPETGAIQESTVVSGVRSVNFFGLDERSPGSGPEMVQIEIELDVAGDAAWLPPSTSRISLRVAQRTPWWKLVAR